MEIVTLSSRRHDVAHRTTTALLPELLAWHLGGCG